MGIGVVGVVVDEKGIKQLAREELDLTEVEKDLKLLLSILEKATNESKTYAIDEAKVSIGISKDEQGKLKAGLWAQFASFLKAGAETELTKSSNVNRIIELTIKRK